MLIEKKWLIARVLAAGLSAGVLVASQGGVCNHGNFLKASAGGEAPHNTKEVAQRDKKYVHKTPDSNGAGTVFVVGEHSYSINFNGAEESDRPCIRVFVRKVVNNALLWLEKLGSDRDNAYCFNRFLGSLIVLSISNQDESVNELVEQLKTKFDEAEIAELVFEAEGSALSMACPQPFYDRIGSERKPIQPFFCCGIDVLESLKIHPKNLAYSWHGEPIVFTIHDLFARSDCFDFVLENIFLKKNDTKGIDVLYYKIKSARKKYVSRNKTTVKNKDKTKLEYLREFSESGFDKRLSSIREKYENAVYTVAATIGGRKADNVLSIRGQEYKVNFNGVEDSEKRQIIKEFVIQQVTRALGCLDFFDISRRYYSYDCSIFPILTSLSVLGQDSVVNTLVEKIKDKIGHDKRFMGKLLSDGVRTCDIYEIKYTGDDCGSYFFRKDNDMFKTLNMTNKNMRKIAEKNMKRRRDEKREYVVFNFYDLIMRNDSFNDFLKYIDSAEKPALLDGIGRAHANPIRLYYMFR